MVDYVSDLLTQLVNRFSYDKDTGDIIWLPVDKGYGRYYNRFNRNYAGKSAIWMNNFGVPCISLTQDGKSNSFIASRVCWFLTYGYWPTGDIDHINHDITDNRLTNLREISHQDNLRYRKIPKDNKSGYKGVRKKYKSSWQAYITINRKQIHLGTFKTPEEAALAYDDAAEKYFGDYCVKNFK